MNRRACFILTLTATMAIATGCSRYIDSQNPVRSLPEAPPTPINVAAGLGNQAVTLSWQVSDSARASRFRIYMSDSTATNYSLKDSSDSYSKTITGLLVNQLYYFQIATVGTGGIEGLRSTPLSVRIGILGLTINNGAPYTNSVNVTLSLVAPVTASYVYISEDSTFAGVSPLAFSPTRNFTLSRGDGLKTVYARFVFSGGSQSDAPVSGQITLDTRSAIDSVYFSSSATEPYQAGDVITFFVNSGEPKGTASVTIAGAGAPIKLYDDGANGDVTANDGLYSSNWVVPVGLNIQNVQVVGAFTDAAGNVAAQAVGATSITIANAPPDSVVLAGRYVSASASAQLTWSRSTDPDFAFYQLYQSQNQNVVLADTSTHRIAIINSSATDTFTSALPDTTKVYYYQIFVYNQSALSTGSNIIKIDKP